MSETPPAAPAPAKPGYWYAIENLRPGLTLEDFRRALLKVLERSNYGLTVATAQDLCTRCMRCAERCHVYPRTGERDDLPAYRAAALFDLFRQVINPEKGILGRLRRRPDRAAREADLHRLAELAYRCTLCGRCATECPMGLDNAAACRILRYTMSELGVTPKNLTLSTREQLAGVGNTSKIPVPALLDTLEFLQDEIKEACGREVRFPIDQEGAEYLFMAPVSDYIMEAETLMGIAMALQALGASWTIGTGYADAINYGLFYNDQVLLGVLRKVAAEARRLKAQKILVGECGHATKVLKLFRRSFREEAIPPVVSIHEVTAAAIQSGKLKLDPSKNPKRTTLHDPCNISRALGLGEQMRVIARAAVKEFVEMEPHGSENYCCGGGGGTVTVEETHDFRMQVAGLKKVEQIKATGAAVVITPCANCKKQIRELIEHHKLGVELAGLHDLVGKAIIWPAAPAAAPKPPEEKPA